MILLDTRRGVGIRQGRAVSQGGVVGFAELATRTSTFLDVTPAIARRWGRWSAELGHEGADLFIAATAFVHGMTVATRNVRHYARMGVATVDPFV